MWDSMMALNLHAPMRLTRAFAPEMTKRGFGVIINIGSVAALEARATAGV
jgi:short-subunit dehydrogenase